MSCDCFFESWGTIQRFGDGSVGLNFTSTLHTFRADTTVYPPHTQELPATFSNGPWFRLLTYNGTRPWENEPLQEYQTGHRGPGGHPPWIPGPMGNVSEHWAALMNKDLRSEDFDSK